MIKSLRVQNFRAHADFAVDFPAGPIVITGPNGSGKTSLLEAIYIALQGKSWRSNFAEIVRDTDGQIADWWRIDMQLSDEDTPRTVKFDATADAKSFLIQDKTYARLPARLKKPVVLFEPNDLQMLYGSPARRRDFLDKFIVQIEPTHGTNLNKFARVLKQRNNLLRRADPLTVRDEIAIWDIQFADLAEKIAATRVRFVAELNKNLTQFYRAIAGQTDDDSGDEITLRYSAVNSGATILRELQNDLARGWLTTRVGPQTHDLKILLNDHAAKTTASRGENRTIVFAMLAAETAILSAHFDQPVYVLFDDLDSELDDARKKLLHQLPVFAENVWVSTTIRASTSSAQLRL
jgi:DNA replication and repair protein RecF